MDDYEKRERSPSPARMSKVPSWISVGFVLGLFVGWALKRESPPPAPTRVIEVVQPAPPPTRFGTVEAVFDGWRRFAAWDDDDVTEIAVYNLESGQFAEFYEVKRLAGLYYFRSIPKLTRPLSLKPLPKECPLQFTDPWSRVAPNAAVQLTMPPPKPVIRMKNGASVVLPLPVPPKIDPPKIELPPPALPEKK